MNEKYGILLTPEKRAYATRTFVLAANQELQLTGEGSALYVVSATGDISVKPSGGGGVLLPAKTGIRSAPGTMFQNLTVKNETAAFNTIVLFYGYGDYIDNR